MTISGRDSGTLTEAAGADVNLSFHGLKPPIVTAIEDMDVEKITFLLKSGENDAIPIKWPIYSRVLTSKWYPSVDKDYSGSPLYWAAAYGNIACMQALIEKGAAEKINQQDKYGRTPVYMAAEMGYIDAIPILAAAGACVDLPDNEGKTPVFIAARNGNAGVISALKKAGATTIDTSDKKGETPVWIAAFRGNAVIIKELANAGATMFDTPQNSYGTTPLLAAAIGGDAKTILALKEAGATTVDAPNKIGLTPLYFAVHRGSVESVNALLEAKADVNMITPQGNALEVAQKSDRPEAQTIIELLESHLKKCKPDASSTVQILRAAKIHLCEEQDVKADSIHDLLAQAKSCASTETDRCLTLVTQVSRHPDATADDLLSCCEFYASKGDLPAAKSLYYRVRDNASSLEQLERCEKLCEQFKDYRAMAVNAIKLLQLRKSLLSQKTIQPTRTLTL